MSQITIQIIDVQVESIKTYQQMTVTHKTSDGKVDAKKIFSFTTPQAVWDVLKDAPKGTWYTVEREKDKKEGKYWNWVGIARQDAVPTPAKDAPAPAGTRVVNTYAEKNALDRERFDFEKAKQLLIVRQSSLSSAVAFAASSNTGGKLTVPDIIKIAQEFTAYVMSPELVPQTDKSVLVPQKGADFPSDELPE